MPINGTMELIGSTTVGAGGTGALVFNSIPNTYDDLLIRIAHSGTTITATAMYITLNGSSSNFSGFYLFGEGSNTRGSGGLAGYVGSQQGNTSSNWNNTEIYITDYKSSNNKTIGAHNVAENASSVSYMNLTSNIWFNSAAISSLSITAANTFAQHTTAYLYGISRVPSGAKATGGMIYEDANYWYHAFAASSVFTPTQALSADILVLAGGGSGGFNSGGGGGAGGLLLHSSQSLTATNYTVTVGAGGAGLVNPAGGQGQGNNGSNSQFASLTASVGGGGGGRTNNNGSNGGSGGGGGGDGGGFAGGTATSGQGFNGGSGVPNEGGGGGGAGEAGNTDNQSWGGDGVSTYSAWGLATNTGQNISGTVWFAGGGAGYRNPGTYGLQEGGLGGGGSACGGTFAIQNGLTTSGGGGGAYDGFSGSVSGSGGSGIVIVRYAK